MAKKQTAEKKLRPQAGVNLITCGTCKAPMLITLGMRALARIRAGESPAGEVMCLHGHKTVVRFVAPIPRGRKRHTKRK